MLLAGTRRTGYGLRLEKFRQHGRVFILIEVQDRHSIQWEKGRREARCMIMIVPSINGVIDNAHIRRVGTSHHPANFSLGGYPGNSGR